MSFPMPIVCLHRDSDGYWVARIEQKAASPERGCTGSVFKRVRLNIPPTATRAEAEHVLGHYIRACRERGNGR